MLPRQFHVGGAPELADHDVAEVVVQHVGGVDGVLRDVAADDGKVQQLFFSGTLDAQFHLAALGAFQVAHGLFVGQPLAYEEAVVYHHDAVSGHDTYFFGRAAGYHVVHVYCVLLYGELDAHAAKASFQFGVHFFQVLRRNVDGVGVQLGQYLRHGLFHQVCHIYGVYILVIDDAQQGIQFVGRAVDDAQFVASVMLGIEGANQYACHHADCDDKWHEAGCIGIAHT